MSESSKTSAADEPIAAVVAAVVLLPAIYAAFWLIDWDIPGDSLMRFVLPIAFCIIVPSVLGSMAGAVVSAARR